MLHAGIDRSTSPVQLDELPVPKASSPACYLESSALLPAVSSETGSCSQPGIWSASVAWLLPPFAPAADTQS